MNLKTKLRYLVEFVLYKLFGLVKNKKKSEGRIITQWLSVWGAKQILYNPNLTSLVESTSMWVEKEDYCRKSYEVLDQFYLYIRTVELAVLNCSWTVFEEYL